MKKQIIEIAEKLGWSIYEDNEDDEITLSKTSPAGQDFNITVDSNDIKKQIQDRCQYFDCSEEAYMWLDSSGHGVSGAPYEMVDVYKDMEACHKNLKELAEAIN